MILVFADATHSDGINQLDAQVATAQGSEWDYVLLSTVRRNKGCTGCWTCHINMVELMQML